VSKANGNNPARRRSQHPYRDSVIAYGVLGALVVVLGYATGSGLLKSVAGGVAAFLLATAWTWWRLRSRERATERQEP
jgi:predicted tellurium resistance membrane protein TerC